MDGWKNDQIKKFSWSQGPGLKTRLIASLQRTIWGWALKKFQISRSIPGFSDLLGDISIQETAEIQTKYLASG